jgi:hypothetical protein
MFFGEADDSQRIFIRNEIESYIDTMMTAFNYERWLHRPYVSNLSAMIGSSLGLAAICLADEINPDKTAAAIARADQFVNTWLEFQVDPDGTYNEGAMYAGWSLRNLVYYFVARQRYDGRDYSVETGIRRMEEWIAFALLPTGRAVINNINDAAYSNYPLSRHHTYLDWAQTAWGSGLASWLWDRICGEELGHESGRLADKAATVLWHRNLDPENPTLTLPAHRLWERRGLYYCRTGWRDEAASDDIVFSFYSGKFQGGHTQEDQNNFTLYGHGEMFAVDHGYGWTAKESEAHNMVFVDGKGQHYAGGSVGTDGRISEFLVGDYADYLLGDAASAYATHSEFNRPGFPFPDDDWSYGYDGGNPVERAERRVIAVHDNGKPPCFFIFDDVAKDDSLRTYEWRMHTLESNAVDTTSNPIQITGAEGGLDMFVLSPGFSSLRKRLFPFDNKEIDPNSTVVSLAREGRHGRFGFLLFPRGDRTPRPAYSREELSWGAAITLDWPDGTADLVLINETENDVEYRSSGIRDAGTDAELAHIRIAGGRVTGYLLSNTSRFVFGGEVIIDVPRARANVSLSKRAVHIDRNDIDFTLWAPGRDEVLFGASPVAAVHDGDYLKRDWSYDGEGPPKDPAHLRVTAYPNPFNSEATLYIEIGERTDAWINIFDMAGRRVKEVWKGELPAGVNIIEWDGTNARGQTVATGVYFLQTRTNDNKQSVKLLLLK